MTRALIIGGGIAGPAAAMALQRAGIDATIYEAYAASAGLEIGAFLTIAVNGLDALGTLDVKDQMMAAGFASRSIEFFSGTGRRLGEMPIGGTLQDGTVTHTVKRADVYRVLHEETVRRGIPIEYEKKLSDAETRPDGQVVARFTDGSEAVGDLLIGADGVHSRTRSIIDPGAPPPHYTGLGNIGGFTTAASVDIEPGAYRMVFGKKAFFGYTVSPSGEIWWFANPPSDRELSREELAATTSKQWRERLFDLFAADKGPAVNIIWATDGELRGTNAYDLPRVPIWRRGRLIVIGDAAHAASPSSGQGASMAVEDAVVLAKCLRDEPSVEAALATHERLRRERVERVVAAGARSSSYKAPGPIGRLFRDLMMPFFLKRIASVESLDRLFGYHVDWDEPARSATLAA